MNLFLCLQFLLFDCVFFGQTGFGINLLGVKFTSQSRRLELRVFIRYINKIEMRGKKRMVKVPSGPDQSKAYRLLQNG